MCNRYANRIAYRQYVERFKNYAAQNRFSIRGEGAQSRATRRYISN